MGFDLSDINSFSTDEWTSDHRIIMKLHFGSKRMALNDAMCYCDSKDSFYILRDDEGWFWAKDYDGHLLARKHNYIREVHAKDILYIRKHRNTGRYYDDAQKNYGHFKKCGRKRKYAESLASLLKGSIYDDSVDHKYEVK